MGKQDDIIRMAAAAGAQAGIDAYEKQKHKDQKERVDRRLRNTKLLLRNYRMFRAHVENAVYDIREQMEENIFDILEGFMTERNPETFVTSIKRSIGRTRTIVEHIDAMLNFYEMYCNNSSNPEESRRYRVIQAHYIDEETKTVDEIAAEEDVVKRTIYRDIDIGCERLAALLFGIDGVKKPK